MKTKYSIYFQICTGIICGLLNIVLSVTSLSISPLYMDNFFTVVATLFSGISGLIAATVCHVLSILILSIDKSSILFIICSYTTVAIFYFYTKDKDSLNILDIIILSLLLTLLISIEGSIIFSIIYKLYNYTETTTAKYITYMLLRQNLSIVLSSFFARIPVNLIDKTIAVVCGYGLTRLIGKAPFAKRCIV